MRLILVLAALCALAGTASSRAQLPPISAEPPAVIHAGLLLDGRGGSTRNA